jgi:hypothetical protein
MSLGATAVGVPATAAPAANASTPPTATVGADVSWPQCDGSSLAGEPSGASFGIVGVNDGLPGTKNPCLSAELSWEGRLAYNSPVQVHVNTADPGNEVDGTIIPDWPTKNPSGVTNPYGACKDVKLKGTKVGANSRACAWAYGYAKAKQDVGWVPTPRSDQWWLDVEIDNTWMTGSNLPMNQAVLDGMVAVLRAHLVGLYSTSYQWGQIVGSSLAAHSHALKRLPQWIPSGASSATTSDCSSLPTFTTGAVEYVQYTTSYDYDLACT